MFLQTVRKPVLLFKGKRENPRHDRCISLTLISGRDGAFHHGNYSQNYKAFRSSHHGFTEEKILLSLTNFCNEVAGSVDVGDVI